MKRIVESKKIFQVEGNIELAQLKKTYRTLIKDNHPDKFQDEKEKEEAELESQKIIDAYHFLVSISPETHKLNEEEYALITAGAAIEDFIYKGTTLKITFQNKSAYEYLGVPKSVYTKFLNSPTQTRFARRHIYTSFTFRKMMKEMV